MYAFTAGLGLGRYVTHGGSRRDDAHWDNPKEHAAITHAYHRGTEIYAVEYAPGR